MYRVSKEFSFCAAHRLIQHNGRCKFLHGHNYKAIVTFEKPELNTKGMIIDFQEIKDKIGCWIDTNWDHNIILNREDPLVSAMEHPDVVISQQEGTKLIQIFNGRPPFIIDDDPTAEVMANFLFRIAEECIPYPLVKEVTIYETDTCMASYTE